MFAAYMLHHANSTAQFPIKPIRGKKVNFTHMEYPKWQSKIVVLLGRDPVAH
jgi:hypothetical protein